MRISCRHLASSSSIQPDSCKPGLLMTSPPGLDFKKLLHRLPSPHSSQKKSSARHQNALSQPFSCTLDLGHNVDRHRKCSVLQAWLVSGTDWTWQSLHFCSCAQNLTPAWQRLTESFETFPAHGTCSLHASVIVMPKCLSLLWK